MLDFDPVEILRKALENKAAKLYAQGLTPSEIVEQMNRISKVKRYSMDEVEMLLAGFKKRNEASP